VAAAILAVIGLVGSTVAVLVSAGDDSDGTDEADLTPAGGGTGGDDPGTTLPPASEAEVEAAVAEIGAFVERERGLEFNEEVQVELEAEGEFQARLLEDFDEDVDDLREVEVLLEGLGLVDPDVDLVDSMRTLLGAGVVGFYDPETKELVVRGAALTPYVRTTIAHELTHALDDQHFDLDRQEYEEADDEIGFGFSAVVEGNARRVEAAYRESLSEEEQDAAASEEFALGAGMDLGDVPFVLVELMSAPYGMGETFVDALLEDGGQAQLDRAFEEPPTTSEQVVDPDAYLAGEARVDVPVPDVPGEVVDEGVLGEVLLVLVLSDELGQERARAAADGWGGDWGVAWRDGDRSCTSFTVVGDDAAETDELAGALGEWAVSRADAGVDASVDAGDGSGAPVTVQSCAG
jgi:hypothetical protein